MSCPASTDCVTCEARNQKCDRVRDPYGCRRCAEAGIKCGGYLDTRISRPEYNAREDRGPSSWSADGSLLWAHRGAEHAGRDSDDTTSTITYSISPPVLNRESEGNSFTASTCLLSNSDPPNLVQHTHPRSLSTTHEAISLVPLEQANTPIGRTTFPIQENFIPLIESGAGTGVPRPRIDEPMSRLDSKLGLSSGTPAMLSTPESPYTRLGVHPNPVSSPPKHAESTDSWLTFPNHDTQIESLENIESGILDSLTLDRRVESNTLAFVIHACKSFTIYNLVTILTNRSTDYDLSEFAALYKQLAESIWEARAGDSIALTREQALGAMGYSHEFIALLCRVSSLANVLQIMDLYAPIFRRACPEPSNVLVNLPRVLTTNSYLQSYATLDILLSTITYRPMFFRYDLDYISPHHEELINAENGPGLRWLYGVPDPLMITLARMNTLLEDFGGRLDTGRVRKLEREIGAFKPVYSMDARTDPILNIGRVAVQESWRLAAYVYLYMGLCGANASDSRVQKIKRKFFTLLETVGPRRNPDSFLVFPAVIIGVAISSPTERSILLTRLYGVSECSRWGTMANDLTRILNDIWAHTEERPAVWSDLRLACLRVVGM
ncbi:unnamed protein product [Rhizoctonia solani]|uniref:Zn(2)-C6 fungal-type domain-containing protein n=1 Tax=Rhizoctonia solani TaxID=456999 RepID=A0A8H3D1Q5_9AGAM|nr:unnamed protein product [Rhizoctonia solani]